MAEKVLSMLRTSWRKIILSDLAILIFLALIRVGLHALTNHTYGFHCDELAFLPIIMGRQAR
jgi:hypothetical protein